ncbi:hypothetical protein AB0M02_39110 [Actinoplanes sp. NPDC051861]
MSGRSPLGGCGFLIVLLIIGLALLVAALAFASATGRFEIQVSQRV